MNMWVMVLKLTTINVMNSTATSRHKIRSQVGVFLMVLLFVVFLPLEITDRKML